MNEKYDDILSYYATQQLINNLTSYSCKYIKLNLISLILLSVNFLSRNFMKIVFSKIL